jgi:small-conductance mechanosensitive channel
MSVVAAADSCYEVEGSFCAWVYERTDGNETVAGFVDWLVERPLQIVIVLVAASVARWAVKRWIGRVMHRVVRPATSVAARLGRIGGEPSDRLVTVRDPRSEARSASATAVLTSSATVLIWVIATISILGILGIDLAPLIAGAGIAGVALGFGAQSLVRDCIAGLFMLIEDQHGIGDVVDLGVATGTVERFSLRTTVLRDENGTVWHVPNGVVQRVGNQSQNWSMALLDVDVAYDTDLAPIRELLLRAASEICDDEANAARVLDGPRVLGVERFGAEGMTLRLAVKVLPGSQWDIQRLLREHVALRFESEQVELPVARPRRPEQSAVDPEPRASG